MNKKIDKDKKISISQGVKRFGGFVRYYDTTEPLKQLADVVSSGSYEDILVCCGGGDQALTILGAVSHISSLYAIDINVAQLFVLAAKAHFLKQYKVFPSFEDLKKNFPGKIAAVKEDVRLLGQARLYHVHTKKRLVAPKSLAEKYLIAVDDPMFVQPEFQPFWQSDPKFIDRIRKKVHHIQLVHMDIFDCPEHFRSRTLDLVYLSDIYWQEELGYFKAKLEGLVGLLSLKGKIITYLDPGDDFMGRGVSPGIMLLKKARELGLHVNKVQNSKYLVFERIRRT